MATRPVFLPVATRFSPTREVPVDFVWHAGLAVSQKQKSIASLHQAARKQLNLQRILEISTRSEVELGRRLSAFNLRVVLKGGAITSVESAYQSSKVFSDGGPYLDLLSTDSRTAKTDKRLTSSGLLIRFRFEDVEWTLEPPTAFYDWLYICALVAEPTLARQIKTFEAFTDIEFNPQKSLNCQARSVALFCNLTNTGQLEQSLSSPKAFTEALRQTPPGTHQARLF